jgi:hypothetical protein
MRLSREFFGFAGAILLAGMSTAQTLEVGSLSNADSFTIVEPLTAIDLAHPATAAGSLTTATLIWNTGGSPCSAAVKIKVFRPFHNDTFDMIAQRGPFNVSPGTLTFALSPPIAVQAGDLIGFAQLRSANDCGGGRFSADVSGVHSFIVPGDPTGTVSLCDEGAATYFESIAVEASGQPETYGGTITGAGSAHGAAGSNFKTAMQLLNTGSSTSRGRLVFHPIGVSASASDPSLAYTLSSGEARNFDDVVAAIGTTGLGSIDVMIQSSPVPLIVTRVFNDAGSGGTAGFSEPLVHPDDPSVLQAANLDTVFFVAPPDLARFRVNFGVRSFSRGVKLSILTATPGGGSGATTRTYGPNVFDQRAANDFAGGVTVGGGAIVEVQVLEGSAVVYMVTVDNTTNDTAIQIADRRRS